MKLLNYQYDSLLRNIEQNYYDLQYLIYALALHKYLQQTLVDYDTEKHFGGVYYLYSDKNAGIIFDKFKL